MAYTDTPNDFMQDAHIPGGRSTALVVVTLLKQVGYRAKYIRSDRYRGVQDGIISTNAPSIHVEYLVEWMERPETHQPYLDWCKQPWTETAHAS